MASGLGLIGAGLKTKEQALKGLNVAASEEARNTAMQKQLEGQMAAAEMSQAATLTSAGGMAGAYAGAQAGAVGGPVGALIGATVGFLFSKII